MCFERSVFCTDFRDSLSAGPYNKITIFGHDTHSHVINNLKEGRRYDIKVASAPRLDWHLHKCVAYYRIKMTTSFGESVSQSVSVGNDDL